MEQAKRSLQTRLKTTGSTEANRANSQTRQGNTIENLFAEITKISSTLNGVASDVLIIKSDTAELKNTVSALQTRLDEAESRIAEVETSNANTATENKRLAQRVEQLWSRVEDQENRNRRNNFRLVGLKEGKEAGSTMNDYIKRIMSEALELQGDEYEIERSHRSGGPRPSDNEAPRVILVKFLRYTARQKVLAIAKKRRGIRWENCTLSFFEDMTKERADQRKRFAPIMKTLWENQVKHTLAHPANLRFTWKGNRLSFADPKKAEDFIRENIQGTGN